MSADLLKFVNPKFLETIDLELMAAFFARHDQIEVLPDDLRVEPAAARAALKKYFAQAISKWAVGLVADLHRIAELGDGNGMESILSEARRRGELLYPQESVGDGLSPVRHDPKHVALHAYLHHHAVFEAAADFKALYAPVAMAEFRGPRRDVDADLTTESAEAFRTAIAAVFTDNLQGDYCRLGPYDEDGEINLVVSHGAPVTTTAIVAGDGETIIPLQEVKYAVLRYSAREGLLRIGGLPKSQQADVAELFAKHILDRPGFFSGDDARHLYSLERIERAGLDFSFDYAFDPHISSVRIVAAAADFLAAGANGRLRPVRSLESKDASGAALAHFKGTGVRFDRGWRLGEITFRIVFKSEGKRASQVTVRLKPPGTLAFRRTRHEKATLRLVARNGLGTDRDAGMVLEEAG